MQGFSLSVATGFWPMLIAWVYLITNAVRIFTYVPQIVVVWRCRDGAPSVSQLTWGSWVLSHITAVLYGALVVFDLFFLLISLVNLLGCGLVVGIVAWRRWQKRRALRMARRSRADRSAVRAV
ncbi:hypothetical protein [Variovorax sp. KK3]|uniref:hypothetical protein n=1 Tax=Variovorax sp. KK3 TaxID=1855728 RepID=UPI00097C33ED|nr:hypothetical protein [Variovorax sp. KK3]